MIRFHARRPGLRVLYSDCGTNFKGADRDLRRAVESWNSSTAGELLVKGIAWNFGPPHSPHWGGIYERLIREAKKHLSILVGSTVLDIDVFAT